MDHLSQCCGCLLQVLTPLYRVNSFWFCLLWQMPHSLHPLPLPWPLASDSNFKNDWTHTSHKPGCLPKQPMANQVAALYSPQPLLHPPFGRRTKTHAKGQSKCFEGKHIWYYSTDSCEFRDNSAGLWQYWSC